MSRKLSYVSMMYMEITFLPPNSLKIKGKTATFIADPKEKNGFNAALLLDTAATDVKVDEDVVIVSGPGDYEIGGVKLTGTRSETGVLYSLNIDGVDLILGKLSSLEKMQQKLKEHNIVIAFCAESSNAAFMTALASNVVIFYGGQAKEVAQGLGRENIQHLPKYSTTREKLPQEVETIVLA